MTDTMIVRQAELRDLEAVYDICLKTGQAGRDATDLYSDPALIGHIYAGPYVALKGPISFVAEDDLGVFGYAVGVSDTRAFERELEREWWPALRERYPEPVQQETEQSADDQRIRTIHNPSPVPQAVIDEYPAHIHMNLLPRARGRGVGARLLDAWIAAAKLKGVSAVHAGVSAANEAGLAFWTAREFHPVLTVSNSGSQGTIWCGRSL